MEDFDEKALLNADEEELMMSHVICGEHELFYLDAYLKEVFRS